MSVVMFPLVFGIIDYGLWFNESLNVRQGVREGVRAGVVKNFDSDGCGQSDDMARLACKTEKMIGATSGAANTYVKVYVDGSPAAWTKNTPLVVCAMVEVTTVTGLVPLPQDSLVRSRTEMAIELDDSVPNSLSHQDGSLPAGANWGWC